MEGLFLAFALSMGGRCHKFEKFLYNNKLNVIINCLKFSGSIFWFIFGPKTQTFINSPSKNIKTKKQEGER